MPVRSCDARASARSPSDVSHRVPRTGHEPFTTGLVDGHIPRLGHHDVEPGPCRQRGGGHPHRATADDQQVSHARPKAASSVRMRTRSSAAFSTVNTRAVTQAVCTSGSASPSATTAT